MKYVALSPLVLNANKAHGGTLTNEFMDVLLATILLLMDIATLVPERVEVLLEPVHQENHQHV